MTRTLQHQDVSRLTLPRRLIPLVLIVIISVSCTWPPYDVWHTGVLFHGVVASLVLRDDKVVLPTSAFTSIFSVYKQIFPIAKAGPYPCDMFLLTP